MLKKRKLKLLTKLLLLVGSILIIIPAIFYTHQTIQLKFFTPPVPKAQTLAPKPVFINIPAVYLKLPIEQTAIENNSWGVSIKGISHLTTSASPTENGPIILYGHNTIDRFGPIRWLAKGKEIILTTSDNKTHTYVITNTKEVSPDQLDIFNQKDETLILYTCSGFADLKRFIVIATPKP